MTVQLILNGLVLGATIALMAIGFTLIFGILRIVNFWHGEAYMFGGVIVYYLAASLGMPYVGALVIAIVAIGLLGWISDRLVFRRFRGNMMGGVIAGIALSLGFQNMMWFVYGPRPRAVPSVITGNVEILGVSVSAERLLVVAISIAIILLLAWVIRNTKLGKAMRAVQQDSEAALTMGINVNGICGLTFGIATGLAALAGGLVAPLYSVTPIMGVGPLLLAFIVVILGGLGSVMGAFVASIIIGLQQSFTSAYWGGEYAVAVSFGLAIVVLIIRPTGLFGHD